LQAQQAQRALQAQKGTCLTVGWRNAQKASTKFIAYLHSFAHTTCQK
jgi:hypothetical protein